jgi:predicted dehydrogenase
MKGGALGAAALSLPAWFVEETLAQSPAPRPSAANDRPGIALIGCGGQGTNDAKLASRFGDVVAICDVDDHHVADAALEFPKAKRHRDFRDAVAQKDVDVVVVGTPDHWHTLVNIHAMRQGKDVYSEKPLTLTIDEGKHLVEVARQTKRVFQTGSQQRSSREFRLACEVVRNGRIGKLRHVLVGLPAGPRGGPIEKQPVPEWLNWDLWQGQAPAVDYVPQRCHGSFRYWYEYSEGTITDWGAHHFDIAHWGLGADRGGPLSVFGRELSDYIVDGYTTPSDFFIEYEYPNDVRLSCVSTRNGEGAGHMWRGRRRGAGGAPAEEPPRVEARQRKGNLENGVWFEGADGWVFVTRGRVEASGPEILNDPLPPGAERLYASDDHMGNFFECVKSRKQPICEAEIGHRSVSAAHLGAISIRLGRKLKWDPAKEQFVGDAEADKMLSREMREPWGYDAV